MTVSELKSAIKSKKIKNFYIFTGDEVGVMDIYINKLASLKNLTVNRGESLSTVYKFFNQKSFVAKYFCYVFRDEEDIIKNESLWDKLAVQNVQGNNIIILILTNVDKRSKFYKHFKSDIIEFEHLKENMLIKYIQREIGLSESYCKKLISICENDYSRILLEIDKLNNFYATGVVNPDTCLLTLLQDGTIYIPPKDAIFDFVDAVLKHKVKLAYSLLAESYAIGENTFALLSVLYNNARAVLQIQTCESSDVSKSTGLTGWQIKCTKDKTGYYTDEQLIHILRTVQKVESSIKSGQIDEPIAVEYVLAQIF